MEEKWFCQWSIELTQNFKSLEMEYFYSNIDKAFFENSDFKKYLLSIGLKEKQKLNRLDWFLIKRALPKPRRFSKNFLADEKKKLYQYRKIVRSYINNNVFILKKSYFENNEIENEELVQKVKGMQILSVGDIVLAQHPLCGHLHFGSVFTNQNSFLIVKFLNDSLGVHKIPDIKVMSEINSGFVQEGNTDTENIVSNLDTFSCSFFLKILERLLHLYSKATFLQRMKEINDFVEKKELKVDDDLKNEYSWIKDIINFLDEILKHVSVKFRLRGLENFSKFELKR